jgi:hypothetical protein
MQYFCICPYDVTWATQAEMNSIQIDSAPDHPSLQSLGILDAHARQDHTGVGIRKHPASFKVYCVLPPRPSRSPIRIEFKAAMGSGGAVKLDKSKPQLRTGHPETIFTNMYRRIHTNRDLCKYRQTSNDLMCLLLLFVCFVICCCFVFAFACLNLDVFCVIFRFVERICLHVACLLLLV